MFHIKSLFKNHYFPVNSLDEYLEYIVFKHIDQLKLQTQNKKEITWITNSYIHTSIGGSETMAHIINRYLIRNGYIINVIGLWNSQVYESVNLIDVRNLSHVLHCIGSCSVFFSQNCRFPEVASKISSILNKHNFIFLHTSNKLVDNTPYNYISNILPLKTHIVYNSNWIKVFFNLNLPSLILNPPIDFTKIPIESSRKYVTMISTTIDKGGLVFIEIAKKMPNVQFLGIGESSLEHLSSNINHISYTNNISEIYAQSDIILMPSLSESWGMVAGESIASGIPVIANPTIGLEENLDYAGLFVKNNDIDEWVNVIYKLKNNSEFYNQISEKCKTRANELKEQNKTQFENLLY